MVAREGLVGWLGEKKDARTVSIPSACAALRFLRERVVAVRQTRGRGRPRGRGCSHAEVVEEDRLGRLDPVPLAREQVDPGLRLPVRV